MRQRKHGTLVVPVVLTINPTLHPRAYKLVSQAKRGALARTLLAAIENGIGDEVIALTPPKTELDLGGLGDEL